MLTRVVNKIKSSLHEIKKSNFRSPQWDNVRDRFLKENPECASCHTKTNLQVHHIKPFHLHPELELDSENLITLCMEGDKDCHLRIGHGGSFRCYNPDVKKDSAMFANLPDAGKRHLIMEAEQKRLK